MEIDYGTYIFKLLSSYFWYLAHIYVGFSSVVKICIIIIMLSICVGFYLLCQTLYLYIINRKEEKIMNKFIELYRDPIIELGIDDELHEPDDIAEMMNFDRSQPMTLRERRVLVQMIANTKSEITDTRTDAGENINRANFNNMVAAFDLKKFFESELQFSATKYRVRALTWARFLEVNLSDAVVIPQMYSKNNDLRKAAQSYFMWNSMVDPFRFFDDNDYGKFYRGWDDIDLHCILDSRRRSGLTIPNLVHWIKASHNEKVKPLFASEILYLNKKDECGELFDVFVHSGNTELKCVIANTLGKLKYTAVEDKLVGTYKSQSDAVKIAIIESVVDMGTGNSLAFLERCYDEAGDYSIKFAAANALYNYGAAGRAVYDNKQRVVAPKYRWIFTHINDPIINRRYV